jgi:hypothetical protein
MRKVLRFCSILCAFSLIAPTVTAGLIPLDISITGNAELDTTYSASTTGNASQNADMSLVLLVAARHLPLLLISRQQVPTLYLEHSLILEMVSALVL